jgi:hypothetical protein
MLNDNVKTGIVKAGCVGSGQVGLGISRADFANFLLKQDEDLSYLRKAPSISN